MGALSSVDKKRLKVEHPLPPYPKCLTEDETIDAALAGRSLSRFGDGELRLCFDGTAVSQVNHPGLSKDLCALLRGPTTSLVCLPHIHYGPRVESWKKYAGKRFAHMMQQEVYGSAFISRPDNQPGIDRPEYWTKVRALWKDRNVVLVVGADYGSLTEDMLRDARDLLCVYGPRRDAYTDIDKLEVAIHRCLHEFAQSKDRPIVLLCLGATATVLAERLARKDVWAVDVGHVGKFMPKEFR